MGTGAVIVTIGGKLVIGGRFVSTTQIEIGGVDGNARCGDDLHGLCRDFRSDSVPADECNAMSHRGTNLRAADSLLRMAKHLLSKETYARLEAETGQATGFNPIGFIEVASDRDRLEEYRRVSAFNRHHGIDVHEIGPSEIKKLFPLAKTDDLLAGFYVKEDGRANPVDFTMAIAKGDSGLERQVARLEQVGDVGEVVEQQRIGAVDLDLDG